MQVGIVSDTHSRYPTVEAALRQLQGRRINFVIHCGDIEDSETVWLFHGFTAHFVFGNCDHERLSVRQAVHGIGGTLHEPFGHLEQEGVRIAFLHGDDATLLRDLENSGHFDFLFHGHSHQKGERCAGAARVVNPGALHRANPKTFAVLDLGTREIEYVEVDPVRA